MRRGIGLKILMSCRRSNKKKQERSFNLVLLSFECATKADRVKERTDFIRYSKSEDRFPGSTALLSN